MRTFFGITGSRQISTKVIISIHPSIFFHLFRVLSSSSLFCWWELETLHTSSGSFPSREVTFHVTRASLRDHGSPHLGPHPCLLPGWHRTRPQLLSLQVVGPQGGAPCCFFGLVPATLIGQGLVSRRSPASSPPRSGSRRGPRFPSTGQGVHVPYGLLHIGFSNHSVSGPSCETSLPWETLPGALGKW